MSGDETAGDVSSETFGPIDAGALYEIRDLFADAEPLVADATLDDPLNPRTLSIDLSDGIGDATEARFDIRWSAPGNYAFHHTDDTDLNFRFDRHPKPEAPTRHFHIPPNAPSRPVESSCILVTELPLVARAILQRWRDAYKRGSVGELNDTTNPP